MSAPVRCAGEGCGKILPREQAWQRFTMLRFLGAKGGGRQRTKAGRGLEEYYCPACALREEAEAAGLEWRADEPTTTREALF